MVRRLLAGFVLAAIIGTSVQRLHADAVDVYFRSADRLMVVQREAPSGVSQAEAAVAALIAGPNAEERASGVYSAIPEGTRFAGMSLQGDAVTVDLTSYILSGGVDDLLVEAIFQQINRTLHQFNLDRSVKINLNGALLSSYLKPTPIITPVAVKEPPRIATTGALAGKSITLSPGHGYYWTGSGWALQRSAGCSPLSPEDLHTLEMCQYLETYLKADGMVVKSTRCTNRDFGDHRSGNPWWKMGAYLWIQHLGYPCGVYASYTGDCDTGENGSELNDDIRSRPLMSDYDNTTIYVALHTNLYQGDCTGTCPTGTETYYDTSGRHAEWGAVSQDLANKISTSLMSAITSHVDSSWACHGACVKDSQGSYGEIRIPNRAAILTELGFHDTCDRDADAGHLRESFFRSAAMWGMYKGICDYFGATPTWGFYSDELVSDTIPTTMKAGQSYNASVTFRNRGVLWSAARDFRLGAVEDSDPFTSFIRVAPKEEVPPGQSYTFTFTMTAPEEGGTYTTDWRMLRDGAAWFGATLTREVTVISGKSVNNAQVVGSTIPSSLIPGTETTVSITLKNTGTTTWTAEDGYLLGAIDRDDPFAESRHELDENATVAPGAKVTFTFAFTAPDKPGMYKTAWRMQCGSRGFGPTLSRDVEVNYPAVTLLYDPFDSYDSPSAFAAVWTDTGQSEYVLDPEFGNPGKSVKLTSPSDAYLGKYYLDLGSTYNPTDVEPLTFAFDLYLDPDGAKTNWSGAKHYCELRGYSGGSYNKGPLSALLAIGVNAAVRDRVGQSWFQGRIANGANWINLDGGAPKRSSGWHRLKIEVTGSRVKYYVDDVLSGTRPRPNRFGFDSVVIGSDQMSNDHVAHVDNISLVWRPKPPVVTESPVSVRLHAGGSTWFTVAVSGQNLTYQWQLNGNNIPNGAGYDGVTTASLSIVDADAGKAGDYQCIVANLGGVATSGVAKLLLTPKADINLDGHVDNQDFKRFNACFSGSEEMVSGDCLAADLNGDNRVDSGDFDVFKACFNGPENPPKCE